FRQCRGLGEQTMNRRNIATVYVKELRDMLRDRRTLISMIVIPTLIMPAVVAALVFVAMQVAREIAATAPTIMVIGGGDSPRVRDALLAQRGVKILPLAENWKALI